MTEKEFKEKFYKKSDNVKSPEELLKFIEEVQSELDGIEDPDLGYGCCVYASAAIMKAALRSADLGITGYQAGCVGWLMLEDLMGVKPPAKIVEYKNMLYPHYRHKFEKTINKKTWKFLQEEAKKELEECKKFPMPEDIDPDFRKGRENVEKHLKSIIDGNIPFGYEVSDNDK